MNKFVLAVCCFVFAAIAVAEESPPQCCGREVAAAQVAQVDPPQFRTGRKEIKNKKFLMELTKQRYGAMLESLPKCTAAKFDCCELGIVPPVKAQGDCGSCWDFSGMTVVESACIAAGRGKADGTWGLSEQFVLDCIRSGGCNGDDNTTVLSCAKNKGIPTVDAYGPYRANEGNCRFNATMQLHKISDWGFCYPENDQAVSPVQRIKDCMVKFGPIGSAIAADNRFIGYQGGGVFKGNAGGINHDIVLVGWDDTKQAWKLRNSWGKGWADDGYCWIAYGANLVGFEAVWATAGASPIPPPPPPAPTPVPPSPSPIPGQVAIALTAAQVDSVLSQSGATRLRPDMTLGQVIQLLTPPPPPPTPKEPAVIEPTQAVLPLPVGSPYPQLLSDPVQMNCVNGQCNVPMQFAPPPPRFLGIFRRR